MGRHQLTLLGAHWPSDWWNQCQKGKQINLINMTKSRTVLCRRGFNVR
jgi:hypothetical protein